MMRDSFGMLAPLLNTARDIKYRLTTPREGWAHYFQLSTNPYIFHVVMNRDLRPLFSQLRGKKSYFLIPFWHDIREYDQLRRFVEDQKRREPLHEFYFLANTEEQVLELRKRSLQAEFVNHNALIDERLFFPIASVEKKYDAIYDAQIAPFKRHELAKKIDSLALVCYVHGGLTSAEYVKKTRALLSHAYWFNYSGEEWRGLNFNEVNLALNQARVGLCLSEREGAMYASIQYLLCGLPIVSTPSRGGRDVFFHEDYVRIVAPEPDAVAEAVRDMASRGFDPKVIRDRTLSLMFQHRERFIALIQGIYDKEGNGKVFKEEWDSIFFNKLHRFQKIAVSNAVIKPQAHSPWS
jgi:glycosyltransferase involved in cell wall biosynthesis